MGVASDSAFSDDVAFAARGQRGPGLLLLVLGLGLQSFQSPFGSEKNYFLELFFSVLLLGKGGGSKANKAGQSRAGQGRQFVIMAGSAVAFWPGGNVIPEIIALAFYRAGSLPHVFSCACPCPGPLSLPCSCGDGDGDQCCFWAGDAVGQWEAFVLSCSFGTAVQLPKKSPHRLGLSTNRGN